MLARHRLAAAAIVCAALVLPPPARVAAQGPSAPGPPQNYPVGRDLRGGGAGNNQSDIRMKLSPEVTKLLEERAKRLCGGSADCRANPSTKALDEALRKAPTTEKIDPEVLKKFLAGGSATRMEAPGTSVGGAPSTISAPATGRDASVVEASLVASTGQTIVAAARNLSITWPALPKPAPDQPCRPNESWNGILPSDEAFLAEYDASISVLTGRSTVPFCSGGFSDVVLIDTGRDGDRVCSGVLIANNWVVTAGHCTTETFMDKGRVYLVGKEKMACLAKSGAGLPWRRCELLPALQAYLGFKRHPTADISVFRLAMPTFIRHADLTHVPAASEGLATFTGYGKSTVTEGASIGTLQVAWGYVDWDANAIANATNPEISVLAFDKTHRLGAVPCGGDSGSPVFLGRVFGYDNERHELLGIAVGRDKADKAGCSIAGTIDTSSKVLLFRSNPLQEWLCAATESALSICRGKL